MRCRVFAVGALRRAGQDAAGLPAAVSPAQPVGRPAEQPDRFRLRLRGEPHLGWRLGHAAGSSSLMSNPSQEYRDHPWMGVFPATLCAFHPDENLDEAGLRAYFAWLCRVPGLKGLVCNGHTGEIMALDPAERARVTQILAEEVRKSDRPLKVISGVAAEGSRVAIQHAKAAKAAAADAILLMPPHYQLRFGRPSDTAVGFVADVAEEADIDIVVHQYPSWTKVSYTLAEMLEMVKLPRVVCIKMGTRDMARWLYDYEQLKAAAPHVTIITCYDEYLLPTLLEAGDGALIGFAGFAPELMVQLVDACVAGDLKAAKAAQRLVAPLARLIYNFGEPGCSAHQRMKIALWLLGKISSPVFRRPTRPLAARQIERIRADLQAIGMEPINGAPATVREPEAAGLRVVA
ncbi:MAG: dihydrodipicolinate synthase family protein [Opitutus sp.]|nr:dihydrodipicolinate synthase family protein [Opitutus sp.]